MFVWGTTIVCVWPPRRMVGAAGTRSAVARWVGQRPPTNHHIQLFFEQNQCMPSLGHIHFVYPRGGLFPTRQEQPQTIVIEESMSVCRTHVFPPYSARGAVEVGPPPLCLRVCLDTDNTGHWSRLHVGTVLAVRRMVPNPTLLPQSAQAGPTHPPWAHSASLTW